MTRPEKHAAPPAAVDLMAALKASFEHARAPRGEDPPAGKAASGGAAGRPRGGPVMAPEKHAAAPAGRSKYRRRPAPAVEAPEAASAYLVLDAGGPGRPGVVWAGVDEVRAREVAEAARGLVVELPVVGDYRAGS